MKANITPFRTYLWAFVSLMVLLILTIGAAYLNLGALNLPVSLSISIAKTLVILLFFMEVRKGSALIWILAGAGFFWLAIMLTLAMTDYATRNLGGDKAAEAASHRQTVSASPTDQIR